MRSREYADLDLAITADGTAFVAHVVDSPAGQATHRFRLPFDAQGLENYVLKLGHNRGTTRRVRSPRRELARELGAALYSAVFDGEVEISFRRSLDEALRSGKGLRIRLRVDAPRLADVPWEYLYSAGLDRFVALSLDTPMVRYVDLPSAPDPVRVTPPLRVLVMVSNPDDVAALDVDREVTLLREATADLIDGGLLDIDVVPDADLRSLLHRFRQHDYHVFHFIGHGSFDPATDDGYLVMEDRDGRSRLVSGTDLGVILHDHRSLRLAVLNACEGARGSVDDPLGGVAQTLIRQGLPAAIAMQFEISDEAALVFAHEFYMALADGYPIDAATVEARRAIFASGNDVEWGTPVLHLRAADGMVFDLAEMPKRPDEVDERRKEATKLLGNRHFAEAVTAWESIVADAGDETSRRMLQRARDGVEAAEIYRQAVEMADTDPAEARRRFQRATELDPELVDVHDVVERIERAGDGSEQHQSDPAGSAPSQVELIEAELDRARAAIEDDELGDAAHRLDTVLSVVPEHQAARQLRDVVRDRLRARELVEQASHAFAEGDWESALGMMGDARQLDPDVPDDDNIAARAEYFLTFDSVETAATTSSEVPADERAEISTDAPPLPPSAPSQPVPPAESAPDRSLQRRLTIAAAALAAVAVIGFVPTLLLDGGQPSTTLPPTGVEPTTPDSGVSSAPGGTGDSSGTTAPPTDPVDELPAGTAGVVPVEGLTIDGDPSDWPAGPIIHTAARVFPDAAEAASVTGHWQLGWDDDALYVFVVVEDDSIDLVDPDQPERFFSGDSVSFEVGTDTTDRDSLRDGDLHVMLAPLSPETDEVAMAINPAIDGAFRAGPGGSGREDFIASAVWFDGGYAVEAAIPWTELRLEGIGPGAVFGANFNVSDGDGAGRLEEMASSNPERTGPRQPIPSVWDQAVLVDR